MPLITREESHSHLTSLISMLSLSMLGKWGPKFMTRLNKSNAIDWRPFYLLIEGSSHMNSLTRDFIDVEQVRRHCIWQKPFQMSQDDKMNKK